MLARGRTAGSAASIWWRWRVRAHVVDGIRPATSSRIGQRRRHPARRPARPPPHRRAIGVETRDGRRSSQSASVSRNRSRRSRRGDRIEPRPSSAGRHRKRRGSARPIGQRQHARYCARPPARSTRRPAQTCCRAARLKEAPGSGHVRALRDRRRSGLFILDPSPQGEGNSSGSAVMRQPPATLNERWR